MFGSKQRRKVAFMRIKTVKKTIKYILKHLSIANVRQNYSWSPKTNSKLLF
jgi:hypothetical protein